MSTLRLCRPHLRRRSPYVPPLGARTCRRRPSVDERPTRPGPPTRPRNTRPRPCRPGRPRGRGPHASWNSTPTCGRALSTTGRRPLGAGRAAKHHQARRSAAMRATSSGSISSNRSKPRGCVPAPRCRSAIPGVADRHAKLTPNRVRTRSSSTSRPSELGDQDAAAGSRRRWALTWRMGVAPPSGRRGRPVPAPRPWRTLATDSGRLAPPRGSGDTFRRSRAATWAAPLGAPRGGGGGLAARLQGRRSLRSAGVGEPGGSRRARPGSRRLASAGPDTNSSTLASVRERARGAGDDPLANTSAKSPTVAQRGPAGVR